MPFSERMGLKAARTLMQLDGIDKPLRIALYNCLNEAIVVLWFDRRGEYGTGHALGRVLWTEFWRQPIDSFSDSSYDFAPVLQDYVFKRPWYEVYDLVEYCVSIPGMPLNPNEVNAILERDMAGYRLRAGIIVPITDEVELSAIDDALAVTDEFSAARQHIIEAIAKLAQRPNPDLRNAITEAVSAVESAARIVTGKHKATLADALKVLEKAGHIHPALKDAWLKLYGYTSDEHGLRHAMTEDPNIDFATAKYMVVSCSAFVNLLSAIN